MVIDFARQRLADVSARLQVKVELDVIRHLESGIKREVWMVRPDEEFLLHPRAVFGHGAGSRIPGHFLQAAQHAVADLRVRDAVHHAADSFDVIRLDSRLPEGCAARDPRLGAHSAGGHHGAQTLGEAEPLLGVQ